MKKKVLLLLPLATFAFLSFTNISHVKPFKSGIYGVCNCEGEKNASKISLELTDNFTFQYVNTEDAQNIQTLKGRWKVEGENILLQSEVSAAEFPISDKWKIDKNENCIKSRKGLLFTRLCLLKPCK